MKKVQIKGLITKNDEKELYEYFGYEVTTPKDVEKALMEANKEPVIVEINSPGGEISSGSAIYSMLREYENVEIHILGQAHSAASVIAMAGKSMMAPTALMMVHCVSAYASGNHTEMEKTADILKTADEAMCMAYVEKSGMTKEEAISMMENETWLTAAKAKDLGLVDEIMFEGQENAQMVACGMPAISSEQRSQYQAYLESLNQHADLSEDNSAKLEHLKAKQIYLRLKGEIRSEL